MSAISEKTFKAAIENLSDYPEKTKSVLVDKRLSVIEKKVIEAHLLLRSNQNEKVIELFKVGIKADSSFVEGHRLLVQGIALNNLSEFKKALAFFELATHQFKLAGGNLYSFFCVYNQFNTYLNLKNVKKMEVNLKEMKNHTLENHRMVITLLRSFFQYHLFCHQFEKAREFLEQVECLRDQMSESDKIYHQTDIFIFHLKQGEYEKCKETIEGMKDYRSFHMSANFQFIKSLFLHLTEGAPIYIKKQFFIHHPELNAQISFIRALEQGSKDEAKSYWSELRNLNPELYSNEFIFNGDLCLFSLCMDKYKSVVKRLNEDKVFEGYSHPSGANLVLSLKSILEAAKGPITKQEIMLLLWGKPMEDKAELSKLGRLVYRLKKQHNLNVKSRGESYVLEIQSKKKAS